MLMEYTQPGPCCKNQNKNTFLCLDFTQESEKGAFKKGTVLIACPSRAKFQKGKKWSPIAGTIGRFALYMQMRISPKHSGRLYASAELYV